MQTTGELTLKQQLQQSGSKGNDELLGRLMSLYRALCVRHDEVGQEMLLNDILALLTLNHQHDLAERVIATCEISLPHRSNNQAARYFYYVGLTHALRLGYVEADQFLQYALRKAPERASGFRVAATKLSLVVQLLLGEIPPRSDFLQKDMRECLSPYLQLTSCVRFGQLGRFMSILQQHKAIFEHDRTYSLILRVRQHVIRTGLRRICQAYSRISIPDVCAKLSMENPDDAEYIIAKAIRSGVIDAVIDHEQRHLISSETVDVYSTSEPLLALQRRIQFLNATHNEVKRSMRYSAADPDLEEERRKVDREEMDSLLRAIEDEELGGADFEDGLP
ncbi:proteasome regulatory non-ATP-ase subunit 3 [Trypanosoma equiperdum]|uniref:26S proteasome regulatory subunit RPN3 n=5 Tax=Trypanozoon TaxID=39700 RepID=Q386U6_TRYB2|nr:proteasome regulatory non-ATPase subunit 3 [Trypanosoma brucei brucei TREU927]AAL72628.1 proteasome regulatory non-ATP-ase subunit 3 [Trypanosoma brucei]EAN79185.1 proteasome regulatory non-ATP-ase subunit 3 [Trypanosoma brucei brucei TREU927]RHW68404.1 proteasome regulatory non-ATP-ase subunit 3 [Trypanosoma brucei equiperdum]SCU72922.1 proteasome regulatory non-ATP-ase subunit 3 [Trypanosoma equiperdum]